MKILADLHHEELFRSLQLMGKRLGATFYRPIGMEWFHDCMWHIHKDEATAKQFLHADNYADLPGMTLEGALNTDLAAVVVTHLQNLQPWQREFEERCPVVLQVGNNWNYNLPVFQGIKHVMNATSTQWPNALNHVRYHPEFSLAGAEQATVNPRLVRSFVHYPDPRGIELFGELAAKLGPEWVFEMYGAGTTRGPLNLDDMSKAIAECGFVFQFKPGGDGYGFNIHRAWALNKPIIMDYDHYADKMAARCMVDGVSSIDLGLGVDRVAEEMEGWNQYFNDSYQIPHPEDTWANNCHPDNQWNQRLKPFWEDVLR